MQLGENARGEPVMVDVPKANERMTRSLFKVTTHRIGSLVITFGVLSLMGAGLGDTLAYTIGINAVKTLADLCYERVWTRWKWGYHFFEEEASK